MKAATIIGLGLLTSVSFASQAQAQDSALETLLSSYVEHAVMLTAEEINFGAQQAVANFAHHFDINTSPKGAVNVTDLVAATTPSEHSYEVTREDNSLAAE